MHDSEDNVIIVWKIKIDNQNSLIEAAKTDDIARVTVLK